jgi:hypothetical protein
MSRDQYRNIAQAVAFFSLMAFNPFMIETKHKNVLERKLTAELEPVGR